MKADRFVKKANKVHNNKYDYSLITDTISIKEKYQIICHIHGKFEQRGDAHLVGQGCGKCGNSILSNVNEFISKANKVHNNKYDYSKTIYINCKNKTIIICPIHGIFHQTPDSHLSGHGCPECGFDVTSKTKKDVANENFEKKANDIHNNKYEYPDFKYIDAKEKIIINCPIHGIFYQTPNDHLCGKGCPKCGIIESKNEIEIRNFIENELNLKTEKKQIENKEIDIYVSEYNLGIEFNGLYWHSDKFKDKNYHLNKTELCETNNIQLLHIFEDEWINKKEIVKSIIKSKLVFIDNKIFARKCVIKKLDNKLCSDFLNKNHLQGNVGSSVKLGLFYENELVSLMTFGKKRIAMGNKINIEGEYEMHRFCNKLNTSVIGGASKLLNHFIKIYQPKSILTFADRRYSNGKLYEKLGFEFIENTRPSYFYFKKHIMLKEHRFKYRKNILIKKGYDSAKTEFQIMDEQDYLRIYDCGCKKYFLNLTD